VFTCRLFGVMIYRPYREQQRGTTSSLRFVQSPDEHVGSPLGSAVTSVTSWRRSLIQQTPKIGCSYSLCASPCGAEARTTPSSICRMMNQLALTIVWVSSDPARSHHLHERSFLWTEYSVSGYKAEVVMYALPCARDFYSSSWA